MAGLLPVTTSFAEPRLQLGYRRLKLLEPIPLGVAGATFRGHEFHYASLVEGGDAAPLFEVADARGRPLGRLGARVGSVAGSFLHLIDRSSEPDGGAGGPRHLRLIGD
jgi:cobyrinic acid a,c-diamide synthase